MTDGASAPGDSPIAELTPAESWEYLRANTFGRLALSAGGQLDIFPINYIVDGDTLLFRTAPGTKLLELTISGKAVFEIDGFSGDSGAWSVVVKGSAAQLEHQQDIDRADTLSLHPEIPTLKYHYVRITPTEVTGRRFVRGPEPERY